MKREEKKKEKKQRGMVDTFFELAGLKLLFLSGTKLVKMDLFFLYMFVNVS